METMTTTAPPAVRRPKAKGILSLLSSDNNRGEGDDELEYLTYHPYDEIVLRQNNVLLRRHRTKKQQHTASKPPPPLSYDALSCATTDATTTTQESLDDLLANTDLVLLLFAEARGCAHSNRVRTMVSHFMSTHHHKNTTTTTVASATADMVDASISTTIPSCCCICILNGAPDESVDWKNTFLEGTGYYEWPPVATPAPALPLNDRNINSSLEGGDGDDESLLLPTGHVPPPQPPDRRRSAMIQLLSISQVPTLVVMNTKTGRPVTHDGLAIVERQWWKWTTYYANSTTATTNTGNHEGVGNEMDDEEDPGQEQNSRTVPSLPAQKDKALLARNVLLEEWTSGRSGWSTVPWVVYNVVSCSVM